METVQTSVSRDTIHEWAKERIYRPGSSSTKEGLAARAEKLERIEAEEEGLEGGIRGIESESEVECIQVRRSRLFPCLCLPCLRSCSYQLSYPPTSAPLYSSYATRPHLQRGLSFHYKVHLPPHHLLSIHLFPTTNAKDGRPSHSFDLMSSTVSTRECPICLEKFHNPVVTPCGEPRTPVVTVCI